MRYFPDEQHKALPQPDSYPGRDISGTYDLRYNIDYATLGEERLTRGSAVVAVLQVIANRLPEPDLQVWDPGQAEPIANHPAARLIRRPNDNLTTSMLWHYLVYATHGDGNGYIYKARNRAGQVVQLHPLIPMLVEPKGEGTTLITHYEYTVNGQTVIILPRDIIHVRIGLDETDHRKGMGVLKAAYREIFGDIEAAKFSNALMRNAGVAPIIISPKNDEGPDDEEAQAILDAWEARTRGENRGRAAFLSGPVEIQKVAFSPRDLDLTKLRRLPEERIAAVCGVPPILANLGAGLENSSGRNETRELIEAFTEGTLTPLWKIIGEWFTLQLLPDFDRTGDQEMRFDLRQVRALQSDLTQIFNRINTAVQGRWMTIEEGRVMAGLPREATGKFVEVTAGSAARTPSEAV